MLRITVFIVLIFTSAWLALISPSRILAWEQGDWCGPIIGSPGVNMCCDPTDLKANNVCNPVQQKQLDVDGDCLDGPFTRWSYPHSCTWLPACGICTAGAVETRTEESCNTTTCGANYCSQNVITERRTCNSDCGGWSAWSPTSDVDICPGLDAGCGTSSDSWSECYVAPTATPVAATPTSVANTPIVSPTATATPTPTPVPITIRITDARCPSPGTSASVTWSGTGPIDHYYYVYRARPDNWPTNQTLTYSTSLTFASTVGKTYDIQVSACNAANTNCVPATSSFSCSNWILPPMPRVTITKTPPCVNGPYSANEVNINWLDGWNPASARTDPNYHVTWVDISPSTSFSPYYHMQITDAATYAVSAPVGFNNASGGGAFIAQPNIPYYVQLFNNDPGGEHSPVASFSIPLCLTPVPSTAPSPGATVTPTRTPTPTVTPGPTPTGAPPAPTVNPSCDGTSATLDISKPLGATYFKVTIQGVLRSGDFWDPVNTPAKYYYSPVANGDPWGVQACKPVNSCSPSTTGTFTCSNEIRPWIFIDGDVHSNTKINSSGGP